MSGSAGLKSEGRVATQMMNIGAARSETGGDGESVGESSVGAGMVEKK